MSAFENEDEESVEEVTDEEKLQITQHYLLSSPPGQFHEVLADVKKIIPADLLSDALAGGIARVSNVKNSKVVETPAGKKVLITQAGEIDPTHYFDSADGTVFALDHLTLVTGDAENASNQDESLESKRAALQMAISKYCKASFPSEQSAGSAFARDGKLTVAVTGEKSNLKNFWSGRWTSLWTIVPSDDSCTISGDIKLHAHYFEDGNLQLQSNKAAEQSSLKFTSDEDLAQKVVAFIQEQESSLQSGLGDMYISMNSETFRSMRRVMPITRTKMEWNVNAVRMVKQVRK